MTGTHAESRKRNADIVSEYSDGVSVSELAAKYDLGKPYVCALIRKAGLLEKASERRLARLREYADCGFTAREAAELEGVTAASIYNMCSRNGIQLARGKKGRPKGEVGVQDVPRADAMCAMFMAGRTLQEIGDLFSVTRERVRQILKKHGGITGCDGGQAKQAQDARAARKAKREAECQEKFGCSLKQIAAIRKMGRQHMANGGSWYTTPMGAFVNQKNNSRMRGIDWGLKFWEWWTIWQDSGKWSERGRGSEAYVMCRFGDTGGYTVGNAYIATNLHNIKFQPNNPYRLQHPDHEKFMASLPNSRARKGCSVDGCDRRHFGKGYCGNHYYHFVTKVNSGAVA